MKAAKKFRLLPIILLVAAVLMMGAYAVRGPLRANVLPADVELFYKPWVNLAFSRNLSGVVNWLRTDGFTNEKLLQDGCWSGGNVTFQGFDETVPCLKQKEQSVPHLSSTFVARWKMDSPGLERYLKANDWHKGYNQNQDITGIFDTRHNFSVGVTYYKQQGLTFCELNIFYDAFLNDPSRAFADETCHYDFDTTVESVRTALMGAPWPVLQIALLLYG